MRTVVLLLVGTLAATAAAQAIYHSTPDWVSTDTPYSTGAALADINGDGWLDLVVSNGNDMRKERVAVYYNRGDGTFPGTPDWQSSDLAYNGHLDVADVNGDGWPDVAVAVLVNENGPAAKVYMNHNGTLSALPEWTSAEIAPAFTVKFGDMNNDGRPDLAVGTGDGYSGNPHAYKNTVHLNVNGQLETVASWQSGDTWCYDSVLWVDADNDGWLDLVGVGTKTYTWIYRNLNGTLELNPSWHTTDVASQMGLMAAAGDVTGDGRRDLIIADNNQLGGGSSGRFRLYNGLAGGFFSQTANWTYYDGYVSAVALADVNADGRLDLATGAWWGNTRIFFNTGTGLPANPGWNSGGTSVVEKIVFGDLRKRGLHTRVEHFATGTPVPHLFYLAHQPIETIVAVRRNGVTLPPAQYTYGREHGWVTVGPSVGDVDIAYTHSGRLDMAITNWDDTIGNYVYYNQLPKPGDLNCDGAVDFGDIDPFVLALTSQSAYEAQYPNCRWLNGDCDFNGTVDFADIDPFVALLTG